MAQGSGRDSREHALRALTRVLSDGRFIDEALAEVPAAQRPWVHEVVAGTLRWRGRLDWIIDQFALKKRPTGAIRKVLDMGVYQLLNQQQVQPAWIVSECVDLVRSREGEAASRFVNAILRKISGNLEAWRNPAFPATDPEAQARWASIPSWIWKRIVRDHGLEWARNFAESSLERPATWVRARAPVDRAEAGPMPGSYRLKEWWPVHQSEAYLNGELFVQDLSSQQLIQEFCETAGRHGRVLDLCAAPGGKSAGLAWNGWEVIATDRALGDERDTLGVQRRFKLLKGTADRIRAEHPIRALARDEALAMGPYDAVWIDAPCTGSGVIRRHPEVRWVKGERELDSLLELQRGLVQEAAQLVRPGGFLMYSVCSVLSDELLAARALVTEGGAGFEVAREWLLADEADGFSGVLLRRR